MSSAAQQSSPTAEGAPNSAPASRATSEAAPETTDKKKGGSITVTPAAVDAIRRQIQKRGRAETSLRLGIRGGGCSGFSYVVEFHDGPPRPKDNVFDYGDVRVLVDPKSLLYLNGSTLDWENLLVRQGFKFLNPNEKSNCGCGHSFTV